MPKPPADWFDRLPQSRPLAEFSLWSANLLAMADDLSRVGSHPDLYHIDVADGSFAPALLFFPDLVAALRRRSVLPFHVHLMVQDAMLLAQIDQFAGAGADLISVHAENANAATAISHIRALGLRAGVVVRLETPVATSAPLLEQLDFLTMLGTNIGVKGQSLDARATARLSEAAGLIARRANQARCVLAADGGIRAQTVPLLIKAGAETVVLGSLAYSAPDLAARIAWLHRLK